MNTETEILTLRARVRALEAVLVVLVERLDAPMRHGVMASALDLIGEMDEPEPVAPGANAKGEQRAFVRFLCSEGRP